MNRSSLTIAAITLACAAAIIILPDARAGNGAETQTAAAAQTVTFAVENMTCAACPITVRMAMEHVEGVLSVAVDFGAKSATVVFDPALTTAQRIGAASTNAGYPATPTD